MKRHHIFAIMFFASMILAYVLFLGTSQGSGIITARPLPAHTPFNPEGYRGP